MLAHLRACSIYAMLAEDHPVLPLLDERRWAKVVRYAEEDFHPAFQVFATQRGELLHVLRGLAGDSWMRTGEIAGRAISVFGQARRMALHEVEHCDQIERMLA